MTSPRQPPDIMTINVRDYDISPTRGYLPHVDPLDQIPRHNLMMAELAELGENLPKLLAAGTARKQIALFGKRFHERFNIHNHITNDIPYWGDRFARRIKVTLDFLGQAYVWADYEHPASIIPKGYARLWYEVSKHLGLYPIQEYCSYAPWNWKRINASGPVELGNIATIQHFLGGVDEDGFILVHVEIEMKAGPIPAGLIEAMRAVAGKDTIRLEVQLLLIGDCIQRMLNTLKQMPEQCRPEIYYDQVRPYIHGWKNNPALPKGVLYSGVEAYKGKRQQFRGESGMFSAIVPSLDIGLNVVHAPSMFTPFLHEIPLYMPVGHREFLSALQELASQYSILDFVQNMRVSHPSLFDAFSRARNLLADFSATHYEYAALYINKQAQRHTSNPTAVGTGGTPYMVSLKQHMEDRRM